MAAKIASQIAANSRMRRFFQGSLSAAGRISNAASSRAESRSQSELLTGEWGAGRRPYLADETLVALGCWHIRYRRSASGSLKDRKRISRPLTTL